MVVSMHSQFRWLSFLLLTACGGCGDVDPSIESAESPAERAATGTYTLSWVAPVEYEDGSPLWGLAGTRIYANEEVALDLNDPAAVSAEIYGKPGIWSGSQPMTKRAWSRSHQPKHGSRKPSSRSSSRADFA